MLRIDNLSKSYGTQILFDEVSLQLQPRERLGLVGRNGSGKSTLFHMILGECEPDSGRIIIPSHYRISHIEQHLHFTKPTLLEEGCLGLPAEEIYDHYKVERILFGLGFTSDDLSKLPGSFSGGFQVRLNLAKVLVSNPNLLLLDEPTNYLDIVSIRWITNFLRQWKHELIIISHDRGFMDSVTTHPNISVGYFAQTNINQLHPKLTVEEEINSSNPALGRTAIRSICGSMMFSDNNAEKKISVLSGGEQSRVMLGKIIATPTNLLLLDEPTNHLDTQSIDALVKTLKIYKGAVILVTHNETLLRSVANKLLIFQDNKALWFEDGYDAFLEKIGWQEERDIQTKKRTPSTSKKLIRQQRAGIMNERAQKLKPLQKEIKELESRIVKQEDELATANKELEAAIQVKDSATIVELSKKIKSLTKNIELSFNSLEMIDKEHERISSELTQKLTLQQS